MQIISLSQKCNLEPVLCSFDWLLTMRVKFIIRLLKNNLYFNTEIFYKYFYFVSFSILMQILFWLRYLCFRGKIYVSLPSLFIIKYYLINTVWPELQASAGRGRLVQAVAGWCRPWQAGASRGRLVQASDDSTRPHE